LDGSRYFCVVASDSWPSQTWIVRQPLLVDMSTWRGRDWTRQLQAITSLAENSSPHTLRTVLAQPTPEGIF
jgi:hypothetical protein